MKLLFWTSTCIAQL